MTPKLNKILKYHIISSLIYGMAVNDEWKDALNTAYDDYLEKVDMLNLPVREQKLWANLFDKYTSQPSVRDFVLTQYIQIRFIIEEVPWILAKD